MSKPLLPLVRALTVATLATLIGAAPALAGAPFRPLDTGPPTATVSSAQADAMLRAAGLVKTPVSIGDDRVMNVALTCTRSGTRMVC